jgi:hypothetical protein
MSERVSQRVVTSVKNKAKRPFIFAKSNRRSSGWVGERTFLSVTPFTLFLVCHGRYGKTLLNPPEPLVPTTKSQEAYGCIRPVQPHSDTACQIKPHAQRKETVPSPLGLSAYTHTAGQTRQIRLGADGRTLGCGAGLRGTIRLTLGRMFESAVGDGSNELVLEQEVAEAGRVDAHVAALLLARRVGCSKAAFRSRSVAVCGSLGRLNFLVRVIDEIFLVRHDASGC